MAEMILLFFSFLGLICFIAGAWQDYKTRRVSTLISSTMWLILLVIGAGYPDMYKTTIAVFAIVFFVNSFDANINNKHIIGWGDVYILPIFCAFVRQLVPDLFLEMLIVAFVLAFEVVKFIITSVVKEKRMVSLREITGLKTQSPFVTYMAMGYSIAFLMAILQG